MLIETYGPGSVIVVGSVPLLVEGLCRLWSWSSSVCRFGSVLEEAMTLMQ